MVEVSVEQGRLEGQKVQTVTKDGDYYSFKGIPYAAPPIGKLRFMEPQPPIPWTGVRKATEHGPKCPQIDIFTNVKETGSEDCLYLNVYSPNLTPASPLPVMVFIHGGGLKSGSGNDDYYGPDFLVNHGVILVTINYRLEVLGFLCLDTKEVPGNAGFKDQVAALKWIKRNISNFGGDSNNITIFGESAGGLSTSLHIISPLSKGLFQRAIIMSGSPYCDWAQSFEPRRRAFLLGKQLGLDTEDPDKLLEFLQNEPVENLVDTNPYLLASEQYGDKLKLFHFTAVVEKELGQMAFLSEEPEHAFKNGIFNDVDVIIGYTSQELIIALIDKTLIPKYLKYDEMLLPRKSIWYSTPYKILQAADKIKKRYFKSTSEDNKRKDMIQLLSDSVMIYGIQKYLKNLADTGKNKTFFYQFSSISERNIFGSLGKEFGVTGASHLDDLMYLFHANIVNIPIETGSKSHKMVQQFCSLFTNFAKYGNPTPDTSMGAIWPEYDNENKAYLDIGEHVTAGTKLDEDVIQFWQEIHAMTDVPY